MARRRYSTKEAFNRTLRSWQGKTITYDYPDSLQGEILSEDEAASDFAELMEDSLPSEAPTIPHAINKYAAIWVWTGTSSMESLTASVFTKITGTFQNNSNYVGLTPQYQNDRILVTDSGAIFRVVWQVSFLGSPDIVYNVEPYANALGIPQAVAEVKPSASGTVSISGEGYQYISGTSIQVDLRVKPVGATGWMVLKAAQLSVERVGLRLH